MTTKQKQTKAKAWRAYEFAASDGSRIAHQIVTGGCNCTVVPDGAPMPMDAATRRLVRAALRMRVELKCYIQGDARLISPTLAEAAIAAWNSALAKAEKAKAGKGEGR